VSNLSDLANEIANSSTNDLVGLGNVLGTMADISGAFGFIELVAGLAGYDLSGIDDAIQSAFLQLQKVEEGNQILQRNTTLNGYIGPALTQLETVQAEFNSHPNLTEVVAFIAPCITTLNDLGGNTQPDIVWNLSAGWPIYWTDAGQYFSRCDYPPRSSSGDVGYGLQAPPVNSDGLTVFYYTYSLPLYTYAVSIFLAVAGSLDANFAINYAEVIRTSAALLKSKHDLILQTGITQLAPADWTSVGLVGIACPIPVDGNFIPSPTSGITLQYDAQFNIPTSALIEYGAVEKYSGYSSIGNQYQINLNAGGGTDPASYYKFRVRLLKRTKDVYLGVGLQTVWQMIDSLNKIVGDPPLQGPSFGDWSLREVVALANLGQTAGGYSLRALAAFIIGTQPLDTPYYVGATDVTLRTLLTSFPILGPGQLLSYVDTGTPGNVSEPVVVGFDDWLGFKLLFAGGNLAGQNRIYAVNQNGQLLSYVDTGIPGNVSDPAIVGFGGWLDFKFLFAGRNLAGQDRIYAVNQSGQLLSYGDAGTPGNVSDPVIVGFGGWEVFKFLFAGRNLAGQDRIYAVNASGQLLSYGDTGTPGNVSDPVVVGFDDWLGFKFLFAGGNLAGQGRIYAVNQNGQLLSYGDTGTPGNVSDPMVVGFDDWSGFKFLFAGGNLAGQDRIYGVAVAKM
jgi:negative regulator of replication initiation